MRKAVNRWGMRCLAAAAIVIIAQATGCCCAQRCGSPHEVGAVPHRPALINHIVLVKLTDPADTDAVIADCDRMLATIPGVAAYCAGTHLDTGRESVDADYDIGLLLGFDSVQEYENYVVHPQHVQLVEKWKPRMQWLRVHDVEDK